MSGNRRGGHGSISIYTHTDWRKRRKVANWRERIRMADSQWIPKREREREEGRGGKRNPEVVILW